MEFSPISTSQYGFGNTRSSRVLEASVGRLRRSPYVQVEGMVTAVALELLVGVNRPCDIQMVLNECFVGGSLPIRDRELVLSKSALGLKSR